MPNLIPERIAFVALTTSGLISVSICLLPQILSWHLNFPAGRNSESFPINMTLRSNEYFISLVSCASMAVHTIVDIFGHSLFSKGYIYSYRNFYSKILIIIFFLTPDLVQMFIVIPNLDYESYFLFRYIRFVTFTSITFLYLALYGGMYWRSCALLTGLVAINSGFVTRYILYYFESTTFSSLVPIAVCLQAVGTLLIAICTYRWCMKLRANVAEGIRLTSDQYCCNIYLIAFWTVCFALWFQTTYNHFPDWFDLNTSMASGENCYFTIYYILITVFEGHAVRIEALKSQVLRISEMWIL